MKKGPVVIETKNIVKTYNQGEDSELTVLKGINLKIHKGEFAAIVGPSGSGKTTLLDIIGCLLHPSSGKLYMDGQDVYDLKDSKIARIRREKIGFIFQQYNLISSGSAMDNVELPMRIAGKKKKAARERSKELLEMVGLSQRLTHKPGQLSGGEQQRVAIARSLANDPEIILADEPTGNLDTKTGKIIMDILTKLNKEKKYTIVVITHDMSIAKYADIFISLRDGEIIRVK